jgi:Zn finger protein HypA/HybF involved in hydrogenase expression
MEREKEVAEINFDCLNCGAKWSAKKPYYECPKCGCEDLEEHWVYE